MINADVDKHMFDELCISDKRSYIRTSKTMNQLSRHITDAELEFQKMIRAKKSCYNYNNLRLWNPLCKYTIELLFDGHKIPDAYVTVNNKVLRELFQIHTPIGKKGDLEMISKLLDCDLSETSYDHIAYGAAEEGRIDVLKQIRKRQIICSHATATAAKGGKMKTLKWLIHNDTELSEIAHCHAVKRCHLDIFEYIVGRFDVDTNDCNYEAGASGNFRVAEYIYALNPFSTNDLCTGGAVCGHLDIVKYGYHNGGRLNTNFVCTSIPIFEWLIDNNHIVIDTVVSAMIASTGNLECLQYVHSRGVLILDENVFVNAFNSGNIEMMKWLYDCHCPVPIQTIDFEHTLWSDDRVDGLKLLLEWGNNLNTSNPISQARCGNLKMLKYFYANGCKLNIHVMNAAARSGHLHVVAWCRSEGCDWDTSTCAATVRFNHIHVLKWLRGVGRDKYDLESDETEICPWDEGVCAVAIKHRHVDILKFAMDSGCPAGELVSVASRETQCPQIRSLIAEHQNHAKNI